MGIPAGHPIRCVPCQHFMEEMCVIIKYLLLTCQDSFPSKEKTAPHHHHLHALYSRDQHPPFSPLPPHPHFCSLLGSTAQCDVPLQW